jgi:type IV pilus assembly protein PilE
VLTLRGFTLVELMVALAVAATLAAVAYPTFADQLRKARRSDALMRLMQLQQAQERWRADHPSYGSMADIGVPSSTPDDLYRLSIVSHDAHGYVAMAEAMSAQARDQRCRFLRLTRSGGNTVVESGPDAGVSNAASANQRCWNR